MNNAPNILAGRYHVGEQVYTNGAVTIHRGHDQLLNRAVGIELLAVGASTDLESTLQDKARRMAVAELPHVAALYDQGEQGGHSFLVIEELAQSSLAEVAPLTPTAVADLVKVVATTLRAAAQKRVTPPRIDADTVRMTPEGLFQIVNWGAAAPNPGNEVALVAPLLALAVTGSTQGVQPTKRGRNNAKATPLERIVERAMNGRYATLDELVAEIESAKNAADDPTIVVQRGNPTVMVPVDTTVQPSIPLPQRRIPWLPIMLVVLLLIAGGAMFGRNLLGRNEATGQETTATTVSTVEPTEPTAPASVPTEIQGQPFVVATRGGLRLNVRSEPKPIRRYRGETQ